MHLFVVLINIDWLIDWSGVCWILSTLKWLCRAGYIVQQISFNDIIARLTCFTVWKIYPKTSNITHFITIKLLWKSGVHMIHRSSYFVSLFQIKTIIRNKIATLMPFLKDPRGRPVCVHPCLCFADGCRPIIWTQLPLPQCRHVYRSTLHSLLTQL